MPRSKCHLMLTTTNYVLGILLKFYLIKTGVSGKDRWQSNKKKKIQVSIPRALFLYV